MFDNTLKAFDIISSNYIDLVGNIKTYSSGRPQKALFLVLAIDKGNVLCCKITSQDTIYNTPEFTYTLSKETHTFLKADSYIQLTKLHTLSLYSCNKIGSVVAFCRPAILKKLQLFFKTLVDVVSVECPLNPCYSSPNKAEHTFAGVKIKK